MSRGSVETDFVRNYTSKARERNSIHTSTNQETVEVLLSEPACRGTTETSRKALGAIGSLNLDTERSQNIDTPGCAGSPELCPLGHGGGDVTVNQPMSSLDLQKQLAPQILTELTFVDAYIVVITARANTINDEGADFLDAGKFRC